MANESILRDKYQNDCSPVTDDLLQKFDVSYSNIDCDAYWMLNKNTS